MKVSAFGKKALAALMASSLLALGSLSYASPDDLIGPYECPSEAMLIELNLRNTTPKLDLIDAIRLFPSYRSLVFTPAYTSDQNAVAYKVSVTEECLDDYNCAMLSGWREIQLRMQLIEGTRVSCHQLQEAPAQEQEKIEVPEAPPREGGVIGSN